MEVAAVPKTRHSGCYGHEWDSRQQIPAYTRTKHKTHLKARSQRARTKVPAVLRHVRKKPLRAHAHANNINNYNNNNNNNKPSPRLTDPSGTRRLLSSREATSTRSNNKLCDFARQASEFPRSAPLNKRAVTRVALTWGKSTKAQVAGWLAGADKIRWRYSHRLQGRDCLD